MEFENVMEVISRMLVQDLRDLTSLGRNNNFRRTGPSLARSRLAQKALLSRALILLALAVSCAIFPNHNPGDDVFKFQLRLTPPLDMRTLCFCLKGQACEDPTTQQSTMSTVCADTEVVAKRYFFVDTIYSFFLTPLTRWDASRFLDLSVHPSVRDPIQKSKEEFPECDNDHDAYSDESCQALFLPSEQAHAFFPMLPIIIRTIAKFLMDYLPSTTLPSTYEGVAAFSALLWNTLCFVLAALALYELTLGLTQRHLDNIETTEKKIPRNYCQRTAYQVFLLFCVNPASVFFSTSYSESTFAMCNFVGHALLVRIFLVGRKQAPTALASLLCLMVLPFWMVASYTRSNGSTNSAWLMLQGLGLACYWTPKTQYIKVIAGLVLCFLMGIAVVVPIHWHDWEGYDRHCRLNDDGIITPPWCESTSQGSFSLYGHVQRKHWHVGIFHYYTLKKIPNFIFAAPILSLSALAVVDWINTSWKQFEKSGNKARSWVSSVVGWAIASLAVSVGWLEGQRKASNSGNKQRVNNLALQTDECLLLGPLMLGHYAVLAAVCAVGVVVAHVEITTRMICSSCPAIYWYMALCSGAGQDADDRKNMPSRIRFRLQRLILPYCFLYIVLGVVMHPNWLPWT